MSDVSPSNSSYRVGLNLNLLPKEDMGVDQIKWMFFVEKFGAFELKRKRLTLLSSSISIIALLKISILAALFNNKTALLYDYGSNE